MFNINLARGTVLANLDRFMADVETKPLTVEEQNTRLRNQVNNQVNSIRRYQEEVAQKDNEIGLLSEAVERCDGRYMRERMATEAWAKQYSESLKIQAEQSEMIELLKISQAVLSEQLSDLEDASDPNEQLKLLMDFAIWLYDNDYGNGEHCYRVAELAGRKSVSRKEIAATGAILFMEKRGSK
jgi:chromosome segregation ATPase